MNNRYVRRPDSKGPRRQWLLFSSRFVFSETLMVSASDAKYFSVVKLCTLVRPRNSGCLPLFWQLSKVPFFSYERYKANCSTWIFLVLNTYPYLNNRIKVLLIFLTKLIFLMSASLEIWQSGEMRVWIWSAALGAFIDVQVSQYFVVLVKTAMHLDSMLLFSLGASSCGFFLNFVFGERAILLWPGSDWFMKTWWNVWRRRFRIKLLVAWITGRLEFVQTVSEPQQQIH